MVFLAIAWEFLGTPKLKLHTWLRTFLTLLGVLWLDVFLFSTGAFAGTADYLSIMRGTFATRFALALFAWPFLFVYLKWESRRVGEGIQRRPILAIIREMAQVREELSRAQKEIERRKKAEAEKQAVIEQLQDALLRVRRLEGLMPVCSGCNRIRLQAEEPDTGDRWVSLEDYMRDETSLEFSHDLCSDCLKRLYPDLAGKMQEEEQ
jgi:hypothetical protein